MTSMAAVTLLRLLSASNCTSEHIFEETLPFGSAPGSLL